MGFFSSGSSKTTTEQKMPAWQDAAVQANTAAAQSSPDVMFSTRDLTAANDPSLYAGLSGTSNIANGFNGVNFGGYAQQGLNAFADPNAMRPTFDTAARDAVMSSTNLQPGMNALTSQYNTALAQGLRNAGYGAGGFTGNFGSTGALAKGAAIGSATNGLLAGTADLYGRAQDQAIGAGLGYGQSYSDMQMNAADNLMRGGYAGAGMAAGLQDQRFNQGLTMTGLDQAGIDREVGRDMFNNQAPRDTLLFRQQMAGNMGQYGGTTITKTPSASPFQKLLGAGIGLAGAYQSLGGGSLFGGGSGGGSLFGGGGNAVGGNSNWYLNGYGP